MKMQLQLSWLNYPLPMKSKYFALFFISVITAIGNLDKVVAQITSTTQASYVTVRSYNGGIGENAFGFRIHINSAVNIPNWSLMAHVVGPIQNADQKVLDPS